MNGKLDRAGLDDLFELICTTLADLERGIVTGVEATDVVVQTLVAYLKEAVGSFEDQELAWHLCHDAVVDAAHHRSVRDVVLIDYFEEEVQSYLLGAELSEQLDLLLAEFRVRGNFDDPDVEDELVRLAADGLRSHPALLSVKSASERILRLAHELRLPEALAAAVTADRGNAHIADPDHRPDDFMLALDLLAHLACEPFAATGQRSIELLLDIASRPSDSSAHAVARVPLHLLDDAQRRHLLEIHEARVELLTGPDAVYVPVGLDTLRANRIVRAAVWQAYDVSRL